MNVREAMLYCFDNPGREVEIINGGIDHGVKYRHNGSRFEIQALNNCRHDNWTHAIDSNITDKNFRGTFAPVYVVTTEEQEILDWIKERATHTCGTLAFIQTSKLIEFIKFRT